MIKGLNHLTKNEVDAILELKKRLKKNFGKELNEIRIFGSKVRGDFDKESDIDVFVVFDRGVDWDFENKVSRIAYDIDLEFGVLFNLIIFSASQLKEPKYKILPFIQNVKKEGVTI
ncbi:MAG: nucleotidyltransferase family protein [Candidatus Zixiibacteriota bacterium]